jgi:SAM-dependent methyltransferase
VISYQKAEPAPAYDVAGRTDGGPAGHERLHVRGRDQNGHSGCDLNGHLGHGANGSAGCEEAGWVSEYAEALWRAGQDAGQLTLRSHTGARIVLDLARFTAPPGPADIGVLARCAGPTLDIGCGPGRLAAALAQRGIPALGVDISGVALLLARAAGAMALRRSVFDRLPGEGRWHHALLIDGNIGIGGDPAALLRRVRQLLDPEHGELLVETEAADVHELHRVRVGETGPEFGWARIGAPALTALATSMGYRVRGAWYVGGRCFTALAVREHRTGDTPAARAV